MAAYSNSSSRADTCPEYSEDFPLIEKPATKSVVWNYFGLQADESGKVLTERERERERELEGTNLYVVHARRLSQQRVVIQQTFSLTYGITTLISTRKQLPVPLV